MKLIGNNNDTLIRVIMTCLNGCSEARNTVANNDNIRPFESGWHVLLSSRKSFAVLVTIHLHLILTIKVTGAVGEQLQGTNLASAPARELVYVDCCKGVIVVDIGGCTLINMTLYVLLLRQATLAASKVHYLTIVGFELQVVIDVRQDNAMLVCKHISMGDLCAYALYSHNCDRDHERENHNKGENCCYARKRYHQSP